MNELVAPLRKLALKEEEVVALKATIILDPSIFLIFIKLKLILSGIVCLFY